MGRLERLLETLQRWEDEERQLPLDDLLDELARATDSRVATVQVYFANGLEGHVVHGGSDGRFFVMGAVGMTTGDLARMLGKKLADGRGIATREQWTETVRHLAEIGLVRGYRLDEHDADLMLDAIAG